VPPQCLTKIFGIPAQTGNFQQSTTFPLTSRDVRGIFLSVLNDVIRDLFYDVR